MLQLSSSLINGGTQFPINCVAITRLSFLQACQTLPSPPTETRERSGVHYPEFHAAIHSVCHPSSLLPFFLFITSFTWHCSLCFLASLHFYFLCNRAKHQSTGIIIIFFYITNFSMPFLSQVFIRSHGHRSDRHLFEN